MPTISSSSTISITPEKFLNACSPTELWELDILLQSPRIRQKINHGPGEQLTLLNDEKFFVATTMRATKTKNLLQVEILRWLEKNDHTLIVGKTRLTAFLNRAVKDLQAINEKFADTCDPIIIEVSTGVDNGNGLSVPGIFVMRIFKVDSECTEV